MCPVGAQLAGMSQQAAALHLVDGMQRGGSCTSASLGVVFFVSAGTKGADARHRLPEGWGVMDRQKHCMPKARSPIKEADAFVIFDEARCRYAASGLAVVGIEEGCYFSVLMSLYPLDQLPGPAVDRQLEHIGQ